MKNKLNEIIRSVRAYGGVTRKQPIQEVFEKLQTTYQFGNMLPNYGDDAAVIPWHDEYLLIAADGIMTRLLVNEPYAAGKASVMVTVNDIYSMGGRPLGMVNVLASGDEEQRRLIVDGIVKGCHKLQVPMLGGHLHPDVPDDQPALSVTIIGRARNLLRSHLAKDGDRLLLAVDMNGRAGCKSVTSWDANSGKSPEELLHRLDALPLISDAHLASAAKDISNAGILGTAAIMMENSGRGAIIDPFAIPKPDGLSLEQWVLCFQSFGFILSVPEGNVTSVREIFADRGITAEVIGKVRSTPIITLESDEASAILFDFNRDKITGISRQKAASG
ncbi:MAG: AIR synthase related protein [Desulfosarcinaceae bacterium]|nr:AIR synthase related protein [Desulfosarcinaceae bacterium]